MPSLFIDEVPVTAYNIKNTHCCITMLLWRIHIASNKETYFGLHVKCPILTKFGFCRQIHGSPQHQILR
jgi:hypothetical protein